MAPPQAPGAGERCAARRGGRALQDRLPRSEAMMAEALLGVLIITVVVLIPVAIIGAILYGNSAEQK